MKGRKKIKISAVVVAKNEEEKLAGCLESVQWCDETLVIDNASTDQTAGIARKFGVRVVNASEKFSLNYSRLRNLGLEKSKGEWVLYVDADERVTPSLREEIKSKIQNPKSKYFAYALPRRNIILGKELKHGWWPDYVKRLFFKSKFHKWTGELHEEPLFEGEIGHLSNSLIHIKHDNLSEMVEKTNKWSEIEARLMFESNHPKMNIFRFTTAAFREFWSRMIKQKAFLDGTEGIIYALYQIYSRFISYVKLWEMQQK